MTDRFAANTGVPGRDTGHGGEYNGGTAMTTSANAITSAVLHEVFSGIQGEGIFVGYRQLFVRLHGCDLACRYCDTPASRKRAPATCAVELGAGVRRSDARANPVSVDDLCAVLMRLSEDMPHQAVSITGGEPLLHVAFLDALLPRLAELGLASHLETNGARPEALAALAAMPDHVAMDMKLPSATVQPSLWEAHAAFLEVAVARLGGVGGLGDRLQVKLVFSDDSMPDILRAAEIIAALDPGIPCVLQPVTPKRRGPRAPRADQVLEAQHAAAQFLHHVRVIPQTHVMLGQW